MTDQIETNDDGLIVMPSLNLPSAAVIIGFDLVSHLLFLLFCKNGFGVRVST